MRGSTCGGTTSATSSPIRPPATRARRWCSPGRGTTAGFLPRCIPRPRAWIAVLAQRKPKAVVASPVPVPQPARNGEPEVPPVERPVLRALVVETVAPESRGRAFGIFYFSTSIAALLSSLLTGELWKHFGGALPFYLSAGLAVVGAVMLMFAHSERKKPRLHLSEPI